MATRRPSAADPQPQRAGDRPGFYADAWIRNLAWPVSLLALGLIALATAVYFRYGPEQASAWLEWLSGPAFLAAVGVLAAAGVAVVRKVQQMAKAEMWSATAASTAASTKADVASSQEETRRLIAGLGRLMEQQGGQGREPDPSTGEIKALVVELRDRMRRIEDRSTATQDAVIAHGAQLGRAVMTLTTGELRAQAAGTVREVAREKARGPLWTPPGAPAAASVAPEATPGRQEPYEPLPPGHPFNTSQPFYRPETSELPAVPSHPDPPVDDEHEDWQEPVEDGPGLPTAMIRSFREESARLDAEQRQGIGGDDWLRDRLAPPPGPRTQRAEQPEQPVVREAVDAAAIRRAHQARLAREAEQARRQMRERQRLWDDPQEGPS